jgi:hypothetical protein
MSTNNAHKLKAAPDLDRFRNQMQAFADWKAGLIQTIKDFQSWMNDNQLTRPEIELRLYEALRALESDQLSMAFVAEFSRGKTELINALFFADYGRRLLPSEAGRTTMCPTELFYDREADEAYMMLLPIETRLSDLSLMDLKKEPSYWTRIPLNVSAPEQVAEVFREVVKTKQVPEAEADRLGLRNPEETGKRSDAQPETVEIPMWRHALISFPHPLLKQGLVILDTPGLNSLGSEPELTLNMLPSAQAIIFVLSADTGVTKTDLEIWRNHVVNSRSKDLSGLVAVLNKIDTLWDEMKRPEQIEATIREQCRSSARLLGIDQRRVFPVSAQKALVGKAKGNADLLQKSHLPKLESLLANEILPSRQHMIWENIVDSLNRSMDDLDAPLTAQRDELGARINELEAMRGNSEEVVQQLLAKAREQKNVYYESVKMFQLSRKKLALQAKSLFNTLDIESIDKIINKTRKDMSGSWTTGGMKSGISVLFDNMRDVMQIVCRQAEETFSLVQAIYKRFHDDHGLRVTPPRMLPLKKYTDELDVLYFKAQEFRDSTLTTMTEQSFVVKKFFISLVSHARDIFVQANREADVWLKELVNPLVSQIQEKRDSIEEQMKTLARIRESKENLDAQMQDLVNRRKALDRQAASLQRIRESLRACSPPETPQPDAPGNLTVA